MNEIKKKILIDADTEQKLQCNGKVVRILRNTNIATLLRRTPG